VNQPSIVEVGSRLDMNRNIIKNEKNGVHEEIVVTNPWDQLKIHDLASGNQFWEELFMH
jgi:hypothetical protein